MGLFATLPGMGGTEKDLQLTFGLSMEEITEIRETHLPAEWYPQSGVQLTWPHAGTDWAYMLEEVDTCFLNIAYEILERQPLLVVAPEPHRIGDRIYEHGCNVKNQ